MQTDSGVLTAIDIDSSNGPQLLKTANGSEGVVVTFSVDPIVSAYHYLFMFFPVL
jgi:hypothetical protein